MGVTLLNTLLIPMTRMSFLLQSLLSPVHFKSQYPWRGTDIKQATTKVKCFLHFTLKKNQTFGTNDTIIGRG